MHSPEEIANLFKRYLDGTLTSQEEVHLEQWRRENESNQALYDRITQREDVFEDALVWIALQQDEATQQQQDLHNRTFAKLQQQAHRHGRLRRLFVRGLAAALVLLSGIFGYYQLQKKEPTPVESLLADVSPGNNKAELQLSNGKKIMLRSDKDGIVLSEDIRYADGTALWDMEQADMSQTMATISVPKGGKYKVVLSDGTRVWLNADSKLHYPLAFANDRRRVQLDGEAYFEVTQKLHNNRHIPFEVDSRDQKIRVTGTAFNIAAYPDEAQAITTLVEGSVNIVTPTQIIRLQPGEQTINQAGQLVKKAVDVLPFIAWKDDKFILQDTELRDLMRQVARWYDLEVSYATSGAPTYFYGEISRNKNLTELLHILEKSGIKFQLRKRGESVQLKVIQ